MDAFSLTEILIVIAVIGVLASVGIAVMSGVVAGTERSISTRNLNLLNGAVVAYNNANRELNPDNEPVSAGSEDEDAVVARLSERDSENPAPGSPYLPENTEVRTTSSAERYRAAWNGRFFRLLGPGEAGVGIDLQAMGGSVE